MTVSSQHEYSSLTDYSPLALRVESCKARARAMRWSEEVLLLQQEMRQVQAFLRRQGHWWEERHLLHADLSAGDEEGMRAYALWQSEQRSLSVNFGEHWKDVPRLVLTSTRHPEVATAQFAPPVAGASPVAPGMLSCLRFWCCSPLHTISTYPKKGKTEISACFLLEMFLLHLDR
jgi:hypothetical protein